MTAVDILEKWLQERGYDYGLMFIDGIEYTHNFTVHGARINTDGYNLTSYLWIMVGKHDPLKMLVLMGYKEMGPNRIMNIGDPNFFVEIENILGGVGTFGRSGSLEKS